MLKVTGQRPKNKQSPVFQPGAPVVKLSDLTDHTHPLNQTHISGKQLGALATVWNGEEGKAYTYMAAGSSIDSEWELVGANGGGGGGGGDSRAIISIDGTSSDSKIRITRSSGRSEDIEMANTIQNTPAYALLVNNQGFNVSQHTKMVAGDGDTKGAKVTSKADRVPLPVHLFDYGGWKMGGDYDTSTGDIRIDANSVEVTVQVAYNVGVHPDWEKYSQGKPLGNYTTRFNFEQKQPDGSWKVIGYKDVYHASHTGTYPNTAHMSHSTTNSSFVVSAPTAGWYRITFSVVEYGSDESIIPWVRFGAYSGEFYNENSTSKHFFQLKGSIKATAGGVEITPVPKP